MVCKSCNLTILTDSPYCPLCHISIPKENLCERNAIVSKVLYPEYVAKKKSVFSKSMSFLAIALSVICVFINIFTFEQSRMLWSLIVVSSILLAHRSAFNWVSSIRNSGSKIVSQFFLLSQLMLLIDIVMGYSGWALAFVIPWLSVSTTFVITIVALANKKNYTEYTGQLMASFFVSGLLALLAAFPFSIHKWGLFVALLYSLFTLLALYMFSKAHFKNEIKKRFKL